MTSSPVNTTTAIAVMACPDGDDSLRQSAENLAQQLQLPLVDDIGAADSFMLLLDAKGLSLIQVGGSGAKPLRVCFESGKQAWRQRHGGGKGQLIARALGLHKGARPTVLDATAGLGGDAYVLAGLGCSVTLVERSPIVAALLRDGLQRLAAAQAAELRDIATRMELLPAAAAEAELSAGRTAEVIYLDPMFPGASRSAAVKKEMAWFRELLQPTGDEAELLRLALASARCRVVVKRHKSSPLIAGTAPSYQLQGKSTRFDIYSLKKYY